MPKLLFLMYLLEDGQYRCHAGVRCGSEQQLQHILQRHNAPNALGWRVDIRRGASRGYDGKPLHEATLWLAKLLSLVAPVIPASAPAVRDSVTPWPAFAPVEPEPRSFANDDALSWQQRLALQKESKQLLRQIGITEFGIWK